MSIAIAISPAASVSAKAVTLEQKGSFADSQDNVKFDDKYLFSSSGDTRTLLSWDGQVVKDATGLKISFKDGFYTVGRKGKLCGEYAVFSKDGKQVIPFGPAVVERLSDRFWKAYYPLEKTEDKSKALIYSTDNMFSIQASEGDTLFTGEMVVFDMSAAKQMPGLKFTSQKASVKVVGDSLYVRDDQGNVTIRDSQGKVLEEKANDYRIVSQNFYAVSSGGDNKVYDSKLNLLFTTQKYPMSLTESQDYMCYKDNESDRMTLIDKKGNVLFTTKDKGSLGALGIQTSAEDKNRPNLVVFQNTEKKDHPYALMDLKGKMLTDAFYTDIRYAGHGYLIGEKKAGEGKPRIYDVFDSAGKVIAKDLEEFNTSCLSAYKKNTDGKRKYYVYDKNSYSLTLYGPRELGFGLVAAQNESDYKYGLYDIISGQQLLKEEYDRIEYVYGYVYAKKGGTYTIFSVNR